MGDEYEKDIFARAVYDEARGEPREGWVWVAWVIKNRVFMRWGGNTTISGVCLQPHQFACWSNGDFPIHETEVYQQIKNLTDSIFHAPQSADPTGGCDHYNNPADEDADWAGRVTQIRRIGRHVFVKNRLNMRSWVIANGHEDRPVRRIGRFSVFYRDG